MTENTQLCTTWGGGRVGHKDEQTISSCFTNRFSARLHSRSRSLKGKLRQQPAKPTSVFHHVPFSHWPISPLLKDNRTNNWPPPQPHPAFGPVCRSLSESTHPPAQESRATNHFCFERQLPIVWLYCTARVSGITAMLKSDGSQSVSAFLPLLLFFICPVARTHCTAWGDDGTGLGLISLWEWPRRYSHAWSRIQRPKCFFLKIKLLLKMT